MASIQSYFMPDHEGFLANVVYRRFEPRGRRNGDNDDGDDVNRDHNREEEDEDETEESQESQETEESEEEEEDEEDDEGASNVSAPLPGRMELEEKVVCTGDRKTLTLSNGVEIRGGRTGVERSSQNEVDGLICPICMQAWTSEGEHHICCLPCGHIYGMSCIKKWLQQRSRSAKCPQCNRRCALKDVRKLYASRVVAVDEEVKKEIQSLEAKCASLETECASLRTMIVGWREKESQWHIRKDIFHLQEQQLKKRITYLEQLQGETRSRPLGSVYSSDAVDFNLDSKTCKQGFPCRFVLQEELRVDGARLFDMDASGRTLIIARRQSGMGGMFSLTKMSLMAPCDTENISLPTCTKAVKDLHVSPHGGVALIASLGKKLSVLSMESNNIVLTYELPAAAWSCAWDLNVSYHAYAGLQDGRLLVFDMRQTAGPMESMNGLTRNPVHSVCPGGRSILTASSVGLSDWCVHGAVKGPYLVPDTECQGVCISLASCPHRDTIVASFRPAVTSADLILTQPSLTPSPAASQGLQGSHCLLQQTGHRSYQKLSSTSAVVDSIRLPRSLVFEAGSSLLFGYEDEKTRQMALRELPSFRVVQQLKSHSHPIRDMKYSDNVGVGPGLLGCLSEDKVQLFSVKLS